MTKKEFKEKIEKQKESVCKNHTEAGKALKYISYTCGAFTILSLVALVVGVVTGVDTLVISGTSLFGVSTGTTVGSQIGKKCLDYARKDNIDDLDKVLKDAKDEDENT